jgi:hypothetical protein
MNLIIQFLNSTTVPQIVKFDQKNNILVRAKKADDIGEMKTVLILVSKKARRCGCFQKM